jgi:hypothetical protein
MDLRMKGERRKSLKDLTKSWIRKCERGAKVGVKKLASLLGQLNFLRAQFPRMSLYTVALNEKKVYGVKMGGWEGQCQMTFKERGELRTVARWIVENNPRSIRKRIPQATLTTDASAHGWGAVLQLKKAQLMYWGTFGSSGPQLSSSNQRESAAVLKALKACSHDLIKWNIKCLCVQCDNSTTVSNLARIRGAKPMVKTMRGIFLELTKKDIEIIPKYLPGVKNTIADALSRLERVGDYALLQEFFREGMMKLQESMQDNWMVDIDLFATRFNRKLEKFVSPTPDPLAVAHDAFSLIWNQWKPYIHPPIEVIARCIQRLEEERVEAVLVVPLWPTQTWWPRLISLAKAGVILGNTEEILQRGKSMKERDTKLPPGKLMMVRI